ncbi:MAG: Holliday junction branch migration protein RuvA [Bacilli bacterium]|jgi:Holliday junction DNA helicase RuvA|nr:Holliday junction branch migration protein RuvA [Bacilli bacterium]MCH4228299.1 Holliday junction branch migration protein RuvA [Bacilli bacterium]MCH4277352.1 Holliday junction branch migration protein RuvA [Bacilli bacterium]MCI2054720.1 Holliday junction branch migration protein RuvA [Bacilli bacterium]
MYYSFKGIIKEIGKDSIALDVHDVTYLLLVSRPNEFHIGEEKEVFAYEVYTQDDHYLAGFSTKLEKEAFLSLIQVKGIGPKTALNALKETTPDELFKAISANNTSYLKKLPGIGPKAAAQIILDLKGKLTETDEKGNPKQYDEVRQALISLGFKSKTVDDALSKINEPGLSNQEILKLALRSLRKGVE